VPAILRPGGPLLSVWSVIIVILGLIILVAAVAAGVAGVLGNSGGRQSGSTRVGFAIPSTPREHYRCAARRRLT
jgi:hypothetical protein